MSGQGESRQTSNVDNAYYRVDRSQSSHQIRRRINVIVGLIFTRRGPQVGAQLELPPSEVPNTLTPLVRKLLEH